MIKIHKGSMSLGVSLGAYRSIFAPCGWETDDAPVFPPEEPAEAPLGDGGVVTTPATEETTVEPVEGSDEPADENTLSNMSEDELRQYASLLGIKTGGLKSKKDLISAIEEKQL